MPTDTADRVDSYFICATPRTGSSLLLGLLESTGVAGHPQAYFRAPDEPLWADRWQVPRTPHGGFDYADYVQAALVAGRTDNGVFGAKVMWGTLDEVVDKLGTVHPDLASRDVTLLDRAFDRPRFVYLRRDDILAQAVSWLRAVQTHTWYIGGNGEISGDSGPGKAPSFDADGIDHLIQVIKEHNAAWEDWFASFAIEPHVVRYEELDEDMVGATHGILDSSGSTCPMAAPSSPSTSAKPTNSTASGSSVIGPRRPYLRKGGNCGPVRHGGRGRGRIARRTQRSPGRSVHWWRPGRGRVTE